MREVCGARNLRLWMGVGARTFPKTSKTWIAVERHRHAYLPLSLRYTSDQRGDHNTSSFPYPQCKLEEYFLVLRFAPFLIFTNGCGANSWQLSSNSVTLAEPAMFCRSSANELFYCDSPIPFFPTHLKRYADLSNLIERLTRQPEDHRLRSRPVSPTGYQLYWLTFA